MTPDRFPYSGHDRGVVVTQPRCGQFEERPMTAAELAAREPALKIAKDIYRHANQAGACYHEIWELIAGAVANATRGTATPTGWKLVPLEPTEAMIAAGALNTVPDASPADFEKARAAAKSILMDNRMTGGTQEQIAAVIATMIPYYRAMLAAAPSGAVAGQEELSRLREIEHRVWHLLDDSEQRGDEIILARGEDYEKLCHLLPEGHP